MKHHKAIRKFGRVRKQRVALLRSLAVSLVLKEKIKTTEAKAKELRPYIEKLITKAKNVDLASRRLVITRLGSEEAGKKMVEVVAPKYKERAGGYVRIVKMPSRLGDGSKMAQIELV